MPDLRTMRNALLPVAVALLTAAGVSAQSVSLGPGGDSPKIVTLEADVRNQVLAPGDSTTVRVRVQVDPKYHIQSNTPTEDWVIPTTLEVTAPQGWKVGKLTYPQSKLMEFSFAKGKKWSVFGNDLVLVASVTAPDDKKVYKPANIVARLQFQACDDLRCLPPGEASATASIEIGDATSAPRFGVSTGEPTADSPPQNENYFADVASRHGWLALFLWVYFAGLGLSLTPCVFPLIPVTLGYFRNQASDNRARTALLALTYVAGIGITYSTLGVIAASTGALFGSWLSNPIALVALAAIVLVMALSMFGLFELRPPAFIADRSSARAGYGGALVMGLVFGVVAAPCTGPATISLLAFVGALGKPLLGMAVFFCLALGLTTPLLALAIFSGNLPRSGMWMVWVKKLLGVALVGVAVWLLVPVLGSRAAAIAGGALAAAAGIWLGLIDKSGYRPSSFGAARIAVLVGGLVIAAWMLLPRSTGEPISWQAFSDEAVAEARVLGKPLLIDFTADWCAPCHELEAGAFRHPEAVGLSEQFVRLRVDVTRSDSKEAVAISRRYDVRGVPAVLLTDAQGRELRNLRIETNVSGQELASRLTRALKLTKKQ